VLVAYEMDGKEQDITDESTHLQFGAGRVSGNTGCNQIGGQYTLRKSRLQTEGLYTTKMACPGMMEREARLTQVLNGNPTLAMAGERLLMSYEGVVLVFQPRAAAAGEDAGAENT
jgi:heat shock protein HslJ